MRLAGFLLVLAVGPAAAQAPLIQHGHRLGSGLAFLSESPVSQEPQGDPPRLRGLSLRGVPPDLIKAIRDPTVTLSAEQMDVISITIQTNAAEAQGNSGGEFPFQTGKDGSRKPFLFSPRPSAAFDTWVEQQSSDYLESARTGFTGIDRTEGKTILRRFVSDDLRKVYVSYAATVETLSDGTYRLSFAPSTDPPPADVRGKADWKVVSPARVPVPQIVRDGDATRLDLYPPVSGSNARLRKLVDYVHVGRQDQMALRMDIPHDSYDEDAELVLTHPRVRVNGAAFAAVAPLPETIRGPVLWVYVPGHGRYVLTLHSPLDLGFEATGEVSGNSLTFTSGDGNVFRIDTAERIGAGSGAYTLRVWPDLAWEPADPADRGRASIGAAPQ